MMRATTTRTAILSLLATFAFSAVSISTASAALPEFVAPFPNPFTAHSETNIFENAVGIQVTCKSDSVSGEISNAKKTKKVKITFEGCKDNILNAECQTNANEKGKIKTGELEGLLGYVEEATKKVGVDLDPVAQPFAQFECAGIPAQLKGDVVGELEPINTVTKLYKLVFKQVAGVQKWTKLVGGANSVLQVSIACEPPETVGLEATDEIKAEFETKINA